MRAISSYRPVTAALRVLDVLAAVNRLYGRATVGQIHQQTEIDKATIVRMLETLIHGGYVVRTSEDSCYQITGKTLMLSAGYDRHKSISAVASPLMIRLRDEIDWPSDLALFDKDAMLVIESSRQGGTLSFNRAPGYRAPVLGTSIGMTYLAYASEEELAAYCEAVRDDPAPWNDLARDPQALQEELAKVREQGWATMTRSYSELKYRNRIFSIGVPVRTETEIFATLNVIYLRNALSQEAARAMLLEPLKRTAHSIAEEIAAKC